MKTRIITAVLLGLGASLSAVAPATAQVGALDYTGLNLGVHVYQTSWGMQVSGVYRGTPAEQLGVRRGDIIMAFKAPANAHWPSGQWIEYATRSLERLRQAKSRIGPDVAFVVKIWRPGGGYWYPWCELQAVGRGDAAGAEPAAQWQPEDARSRRLFGAAPGDYPPEPWAD